MLILFLPNWKVEYCDVEPLEKQPPDYCVDGQDYWFFRYFNDKPDVDIIDIRSIGVLENIEKNKLRFYIIQAIKAIPQLNKYDLIVSHGMQSGIVIALWRRLFRTRSKHIVFDIGAFNSAAESGFALKLMQFASKSIDGIIYHTSSQRDYYKKYFPWVIDKSEFIKFGTDFDFFNGILENHSSDNCDESGKDYCICVGYAKRDWDTLVKAFQLADTENLVLKLVGNVNEKYYGLTNIEQIGFVPIKDLMALIRDAKFSILPLKSFNYSYGQMTLMQQMAMGKCVITSRVPSLMDYIEDGKTALLYEPENFEQLAELIETVNVDEKLRYSIAKNAQKYISDTNNEKVMAKEIECFLRKYK
ncbi:glycosyltransferase family 4 protein [Butyrivibrio sp.]|uniref:glycosyltransferase family 4 protein n=1 Tax=Butyrivibrio sp. TaxID=28121 RepID=UPI0025BC8024|nr:glycosyltransferase family 4 protein [Butyrivibrio sp.]MBE5837185.1 glycosyltransferase family 4 protein [Butyrivibrio sp.]